MKKRLALVLAGIMAVGALTGCGSGSESGKKTYKIGVTQIADHPSLDNCREGFIQGLAAEGFTDGDNIKIDYKSAAGDMSTNSQIAQTYASGGYDLVCGIATPSAQALYAACHDKGIPVVFNAISDPVAAQLAKSETEPLDGITGVSDKLPVTDQLKLIRNMLPDSKKIGIIYTTSEANSVSTIETYKKEAPNYGFEIETVGIGSEAEVAQAADVILEKVDCISNMTDNTVVSALAVVLDKANAKNIPVFGSEEEQVKNGCIASAGLDYIELGKQAGIMAAKILNGEDISSIPYETLKESKITVNKAVCEKLGITAPAEVLDSATVVE
ncbi:MAG: ABC transporter substrate-binding protein [Clostridiales bacterium]|nr:ABC transporter substrate-binding protein [Clostridiales bacterium]